MVRVDQGQHYDRPGMAYDFPGMGLAVRERLLGTNHPKARGDQEQFFLRFHGLSLPCVGESLPARFAVAKILTTKYLSTMELRCRRAGS
jgi:hypothetical protein